MHEQSVDELSTLVLVRSRGAGLYGPAGDGGGKWW